MKILIIEDEKLAVEKLLQVLNKVLPSADIVGITDSIQSSVNWLGQYGDLPDLVFMDIELADGQSFAIFEQVDIKCPVIFVTSYDEYALKAFKVNSIDYLLKPIQQDELQQALDKFVSMQTLFGTANPQPFPIDKLIRELQRHTESKSYRTRFLVKYLQRFVSIEVSAIAYFFYEDRVTFFSDFSGKNYTLDYTLDEVENMVDPALFFRINRSQIVSVKAVDQIHPYFGNRLALRLHPDFGKESLVSREKVNEFKNWMGR